MILRSVSILSLLCIAAIGLYAQPQEKYIRAMEARVPLLDSNNQKADEWKDLGNSFERIAEAEKSQWLPFYYAALCQVRAAYALLPPGGGMGDNTAITDPLADKAEQLVRRAEALQPVHADIHCLWKMVYGLRMMGNPMQRFMTEGARAAQALEKARAVDPFNPRIYILEAQDKFFTPEAFGGSKKEARRLFEKADSLFRVKNSVSTIEPRWGAPQVRYFLSQL
jgi:hypothetical protein